MFHIKSDSTIYSFCEANSPALTVPSGSRVVMETLDCFSNQLKTPEDKMAELDWNKTNPATGPVYIEGAQPGDTLKVTVEKIELADRGVAVCGEGMGTLGHILTGSHTRIIEVSNGSADFSSELKIPVSPMIGVIGVAPAGGEAINNGTPGHHGGNMDNKMITEGAILYFPVSVEGAGFALGDVHAVMGDGEIGVTGLEIPANVTVKLDVIKNRCYSEPVLENSDCWSVIVSRDTLDAAAADATEVMFRFLKERMDMEDPEITMLMSLAAQLQICQIVDPLKTVRFVISKDYTGNIDF